MTYDPKAALTDANTALSELEQSSYWQKAKNAPTTHLYKADQALHRVISELTPDPTQPPPPTPTPTPTPTPVSGKLYGTANGWHFQSRSPADRAFELSKEVDVGAKIMRIDGSQPWACDEILAKGIEPYCLLGSNPTHPWAKTPAQFATECGNAAAALVGKVTWFEILNEPDLHGWTADTYFPYLKACYQAIKAANPKAKVAHAGMFKGSGGTFTIDWYDRIYALGGKDYFDAANVHPYDDPAEHGIWSMWDITWGSGGVGSYDTRNIRSVMNAHGDSAKPILATEAGGPTPKYSLTKQATIVTNALKCADGVGTGYRRAMFVLIFSMLDDDVPGFGLLDGNRNPRLAYNAFQSVTKA